MFKTNDKVIVTIGNKSTEFVVVLILNHMACLEDASGRKDAYGRVRTANLWATDEGYSFRTGNGQRKPLNGNVCIVRNLQAA